MPSNRTSTAVSILKGFLTAAAITLLGMLLIALITVFSRLSDTMLTSLNQILKILSIILGTCVSVGRGGSRGFVTGTVIALLYMIAGYSLYVVLGGGVYSFPGMLGEMLMGAAVGAVTGTVLANLQPRKRRRTK